ncbi:hypothetical protein [Flexithrix dorotheae]|uniref:hypothetical protein n=1 Tax=Flexithrix dorotheae TaxID=70993 RepID=UPI000364F288|nr:hypothetical protein [Flexithrix dorotheae]
MALPLLLGSGIKDAVGSIPPVVWKALIATGLGVGAYLIVRKVVQNARRQSAIREFGRDGKNGLAVDLATLFYQAIWENDPVGWSENEPLIFDTAKRVKNEKGDFGLVHKAYKKIYDRDLLKDIQKALNPEEFVRFNEIIDTGIGILGQVPFTKLVATINPTTVFAHDLQQAKRVNGRVKLGRHFETIVLGDNRKLTGFMKNKNLFYVPEKDIRLINA